VLKACTFSLLRSLFFGLLGALVFGTSAWAQDLSFLGTAPGNLWSLQADLVEAGLGSEQRVSLSAPLWTRESQQASLQLKGHRFTLDRDLRLPGGLRVPQELGAAELGFGWKGTRASGDGVGIQASLSSSGRRLLRSDAERAVNLTASYELKGGGEAGDHWLFFLNYADNRSFWNGIPLPGAAYVLTRPQLRAVLGLPFVFLFWMPQPVWTWTAAISPFFVNLEGAYRWAFLQFYAGYAWTPRSYPVLADAEAEERLILDRQDLNLGLRYAWSRQGSLSLSYVHGLSQRVFLSDSLYRPGDQALRPDAGAGWALRMRQSF
jgi:hypothetical protein